MTRTARAMAVLALASAAAFPLAAQNPPAPPAPQGPPGQQPQTPLPPNGWRVDPNHSAITFRVRHLGITWVNGKFGSWTSELVYDPANPEAASVTAHIRTASVNTEVDRRDNDIRQNYFVADSFPEITFTSTRVERAGDTHLRITGDLTIHGVTKAVVLETEINGQLNGSRGKRVSFTGTTTISRREFGILRNPFMEGA
ncbi:MAG: YceI family protein, partial [Gemmatimonadales bacterium]